MTSATVILTTLTICLGLYIYKLEADMKELEAANVVLASVRDRWRKWVTIQKGIIEKHMAYLAASKLGPAFDYWCKESMTPDPELVHKISEAMSQKDEVSIEEPLVEVISDNKVVIIAPPRLLAAT
jgi:hypothetical protein